LNEEAGVCNASDDSGLKGYNIKMHCETKPASQLREPRAN
jgi:hypothetical protein